MCAAGDDRFELQRHLVATHAEMPIIFITAHGDEEMRLRSLSRAARSIICSSPSARKAAQKAVQKALAPE